MRRRLRNTGQVMPVLLTLTVLLATCCGGRTTSPPTPTPTTPIMGDFTGQVSGLNADIGLSTNGRFLHALATDGTDNTITTFLRFDGPVTNNAVDLKDKFGMGADLMATWNAQAASGTVTYKGNSYDFNAPAVTDPPIHAGLYQGQTLFGVPYLAGWVVLPGTAAAQVQRGGIINEQTRALMPAPALTAQDIASGQLVVPGLGTFMLTLIQSGKQITVTVVIPSPTQITVTPQPPVLSVSPGRFSLPGDPNCSFDSKAGVWNCTATLTNSGQSGDLNWFADSPSSGVTFNPPSGILSAGTTTSVIISLTGYFCTDSTLIFSGPVNSVTVSVGCPPK